MRLIKMVCLFVVLFAGTGLQVRAESNADVILVGLMLNLRKDAASVQSAANALGRLGRAAEPAIPALIDALRHDDEPVAKSVSDALVQIGSDSIPGLTQALDDANFILRRRAAETLGRFGSDAKRAVPDLVNRLQDAQTEVVAAATQSLLQIKDGAVGALGSALKKESPGNRRIILMTLAKLGPSAYPVLLDTLKKDSTPFVRLSAAEAIGSIQPREPHVVPELTAALLDLEESVRGAVVDALGTIGPDAKSAMGRLIVLAVSDKDSLIRRKAMTALEQIGAASHESVPGLVEEMRNPSPEIRQAILAALSDSEIPLSEGLPICQIGFMDGNPEVRMKSLQAANRLAKGGCQAFPLLAVAVNDAVGSVRQIAVQELGRCKEKASEAAVEVSKVLSDPNPALRQHAIQSLASLGSAGLTGLIQALNDPFSVLSDQAAAAIVKLGPEAIPALQELQKGLDPDVKKKASNILKKIQRKSRRAPR